MVEKTAQHELLCRALWPLVLVGNMRQCGDCHRTRTSAQFIAGWGRLMSVTLEKPASPILYQYVTDGLFKQLMKWRYPLAERPDDTSKQETNKKSVQKLKGLRKKLIN